MIEHKTITEPYGVDEHQETVTPDQGRVDSTAKATTMFRGEIQILRSATNVARVQPPNT